MLGLLYRDVRVGASHNTRINFVAVHIALHGFRLIHGAVLRALINAVNDGGAARRVEDGYSLNGLTANFATVVGNILAAQRLPKI